MGEVPQALPSPEKEAVGRRPSSAESSGKSAGKKASKKKNVEPKPETWKRPLSMGEADLKALDEHKHKILNETKNVSSFVVIGQTLHEVYYEQKRMKTQKEFLEWTKAQLGFSKSTTYEYIISYRIYSDIASKLPAQFRPPMYQSHCQLLSKVPAKKLVDTWIDVCTNAPNGVITTAFLEHFLEKNNLKVPKSRVTSNGDQDDTKSEITNIDRSLSDLTPLSQDQASVFSEPKAEPPTRTRKASAKSTPRKSLSAGDEGKRATRRTASGKKRSREEDDDSDYHVSPRKKHNDSPIKHKPSPHRNDFRAVSAPPPLSLAAPDVVPVLLSPPMDASPDESAEVNADNARPRIPFSDGVIYELCMSVIGNQRFDVVLQTIQDFKDAEGKPWPGRLWCNLCGIRPFSTTMIYSGASPSVRQISYVCGLERLLEVIFTKFANKEFSEGLFLMKAEFGADWFTPILQHPYCILPNNNEPTYRAHPRPFSTLSENGDGVMDTEEEQVLHSPYESYIVFYLGPNVKDFISVFRTAGLIPGVNSWSAVMDVPSIPGIFIPAPIPEPEHGHEREEQPAPMDEDEMETDSATADLAHLPPALSEAASALVEIARVVPNAPEAAAHAALESASEEAHPPLEPDSGVGAGVNGGAESEPVEQHKITEEGKGVEQMA
ncbi:uncharacterized protein EV422DRAFT_409386 [Fimicolochytrium jonesii]|uniref:uncharacterized protein n=1 Tax=Fimicolochytrium jonesii TaxID=1396493 RepID=UPI0022FDF4A1|nr:uncharacterized protein EV422DRAFT_409386 [Fimicolochytrium jonesii]KAI8822672.1 hypothetical protein EV422DRAFT_409386 [Fimicolochytrium jonesii]